MHRDILKYDGRRPEPSYGATEGAECEECERYRGLLLWALYHHQGSISDVGQPIRLALGIGRSDRLTDAQIAFAKATVEALKAMVP